MWVVLLGRQGPHRKGREGKVGNQATESVVGNEGRVLREGKFGYRAGAVPGVEPALDG